MSKPSWLEDLRIVVAMKMLSWSVRLAPREVLVVLIAALVPWLHDGNEDEKKHALETLH